MRNPRKRNKILNLIKKIWEKYPDLRLMQLLGNCFEAGDLYYTEDKNLEKRLKEIYKI